MRKPGAASFCKSIGTLALGHLLTTDVRLAQARVIWLTPLLKNDRLRVQIQQCRQRSLFVIRSADPHYDRAYLAETQAATHCEMVIIDGAGHSLEIKDDVFRSLQALERMMHAVQAFLA